MEQISFRLQDFEGPLDLILHLISKHKLNLYDIQIAALLEQYMAYMNEVQLYDPEISSEFLEMASRLVYMKTVMLLPKHEEEEEKLRSELTGQLIEYQLCKQVAELLRRQSEGLDWMVRRPDELPIDLTYTRRHLAQEIKEAYLLAAGKVGRRLPPKEETFAPIVTKKIVSVNGKIIYLLKKLYKGTSRRFLSLFEESSTRSDMVATFLALLELVKAKRVTVSDDCAQVKINRK